MIVSLRDCFVPVVLSSVVLFTLCAFSQAQNASAPDGNAVGRDNNGHMTIVHPSQNESANEIKQSGNTATST
jgi:hypothetical protein